MNLQNRIEKLEQRAGMNANAECPHGVDMRTYDNGGEGYFIGDKPSEADRVPTKICDVCGREQNRISIVFVKKRDEHETGTTGRSATFR